MSGEASTSTRILFVDDSKVMLKTASKILSAEFDVITAIDGDDAWGKLEHDHDIQVLFTDINMPGTDGYGLLGKVRTADDPGLNAMPVILVTGADDDDEARQTALDRGATDFLNKKYIGTELLTRARAHAKYQRISRQLQAQTTLDPMTGLANEHGFLDRLEQDIAYAHRHGHELALMRVEVDHLVALYEARGNKVVEPIVVHVANLIRSRIRTEDTAAHVGLGGFVISVPGGELHGVEVMATWLKTQAAAMAPEIDGRRLAITLSTAVIGDESKSWTNAKDAMARCQAALDRARQQAQAEVQAAAERAHQRAEAQAAAERARQHAEAQAAMERAHKEAEAQAEAERVRQQAEAQAAIEHARQQAEAQAALEHAHQQAEAQAALERERAQAEAQAAIEHARQQAEAQAAAERTRRHAEAQAASRARQQAEARAARKAKKQARKTKPETKSAPARSKVPERDATQTQMPVRTPVSPQPAASQQQPKPDLTRKDVETLQWPQRLMVFLRLQGTRLVRFFRKRIGK